MLTRNPAFGAIQTGLRGRWTRRALVASAAACCLALTAAPAAAQPRPASLFERLPAPVKNAKVLRMVGDAFAPYRIVGDDGKTVTGIDMDFARALEPLLGVRIEMSLVSNLPAILAGIDTGRYDFTMGPVLSTKPREERYDILTWIVSKPAFMIPVAGGKKAAKIEDTCGWRVAYPTGSTAQEDVIKQVSARCAAAKQPALVPVALADQNATVLAAQAGRADMAGMQLAGGLYLNSQNPGRFQILTDSTDQLGILHQGILAKKGSDLAPVLRDAMRQLFASGEYARIMDKWGLGPARAPEVRLNPSSSAK